MSVSQKDIHHSVHVSVLPVYGQFEGSLNRAPARREKKLFYTAISVVVFPYETDVFPVLAIARQSC